MHNHITTIHIISYTTSHLSHTTNLSYTATHNHSYNHIQSHIESFTHIQSLTHSHTHNYTPPYCSQPSHPKVFLLNLIPKMSSNKHWEEHSSPNYKANLSSPLIHMKF